MRLFRIAIFGLGTICSVTLGSGCYPVKLSPECKNAISACLASCDGQSSVSAPAMTSSSGHDAYPTDHRSDCESACQGSCGD
ncbi:MAG: hypothetical protein M0R80_29290 [Proteobacteria bacterium]|jgi:hypothetical protein|nr:hypothetical protein [Pseudomonadota bacterium]